MATASRASERPSVSETTPSRAGWSAVVTVVWVGAAFLFLLYSVQLRPFQRIVGAGETLLYLILQHFLFVAVIVAVLLMVGGVLGSSLGLPGLFRDPPVRDVREERQRRKRKDYLHARGNATAFWGAFGATFVIAIVWTSIFYAEVVEHIELFNPDHLTRTIAHSMRDIWTLDLQSHRDLLRFILVTASPFLVLLLLAEWFPAPAPGIDREGRERTAEFLHAVGGVVAGAVLVVGLVRLGGLSHGYVEPLVARLYTGSSGWFSFFRIDEQIQRQIQRDPGQEVKLALITSFAQFTLITALSLIAFAATFRRTLSPGLGICMLLSIAVLFVFFLAWLSTVGQTLVLLLLLALIVLTNGDRYKYRFPGMADYYEKNPLIGVGDLPAIFSRSPSELDFLDNEEVLERWRKRTGQERPQLILVATTGGAYRASFWTTVVLEELRRTLGPDFYRHIRLFTGASGGMVGAAYFVAAMTEDGPPPEPEGFTERLREESGLDSLSPVVRRLLLGDLPGTFWPFVQEHDRGIELERQWMTLDKSFKELSEGEKAGWRPSLIVSPMVVESGRRLLISNLDLSRLAETRPLDPSRLPADDSVMAEAARLYSRSAVEFFRVYPEARPTFSLQTAVRMSATFPLASPAVSLPFDPPRRVVDAGYYDNYGVDLATSWIYGHQEWIRENTSGVALIQIRAYPSEQEVLSYFGAAPDRDPNLIARFKERVVSGFQGLTSPLAGGLSAREWSMRFRNATQVCILDNLLNGPGKRDFFATFIFENFLNFAMNWCLSDHDIDAMRRSIGAYHDPEVAGSAAEGMPAGLAGMRSNSEIAKAARKVCKDANQEQKARLARWFKRRSPVAEPA